MLILIAESKTMTLCADPVAQSVYEKHRPLLEDKADDIMLSIRDVDAAALSRAVRISPRLAVGLQRMIYEFPNKSLGSSAMEAYTGVVFRAFDYSSLSSDEKSRATSSVRVISSLYGWLRPDDIIRQYRFDFTTPLAPDRHPFYAYWRDTVTDCLLEDIKQGAHTEVLDLLPADAAKCVDWARIKTAAAVHKVNFREMHPGGTFKTPTANRLKTLRGLLLRQIITQNITDTCALSRLLSDDYISDANLTFICERQSERRK